jgi:hypothetical protein
MEKRKEERSVLSRLPPKEKLEALPQIRISGEEEIVKR